MARFCGIVGYADTVEVRPGVWEEQFSERRYFGDLIRNKRSLQSTNQLNDNINVANEISIVADPYANTHFHLMKYVEYRGTKWKITDVDASQYPRLILTIGGVYNGSQA